MSKRPSCPVSQRIAFPDRVHLAICICVALVLIGTRGVLLARDLRSATVHEYVSKIEAASCGTAEDVAYVVDHAASSDRSVMFVNVDWAFMSPAKEAFAAFAIDYHSRHRDKTLFHYVDCTPVSSGYEPLRELPGWRQLMNERGGALIHGYGEVVWLDHGSVVDVKAIGNFESTDELIRHTETLFTGVSDAR